MCVHFGFVTVFRSVLKSYKDITHLSHQMYKVIVMSFLLVFCYFYLFNRDNAYEWTLVDENTTCKHYILAKRLISRHIT